MNHRFSKRKKRFLANDEDARIRIASMIFGGAALVIIGRLFMIMILQHGFYSALAQGTQEIYSKLIPERGEVYLQDSRSKDTYPLALNKDVFLMYADTRKIEDDDTANMVASELAQVFNYDDEKKFAVYLKINKRTDPYEPLEKTVEEDVVDVLREKELPGIHFIRKPQRYYPEGNLAAHALGFLGKNEEGNDIGSYGVEGYWNQELSGTGGFLEGARSAGGGWIPLAGRLFKPAEDGKDLVLTLDRTIQFKACEILRESMKEYEAESASLVAMNPHTGAILAMCSLPDFDPNRYSQVESGEIYNNSSIINAYEIGSVFKPIAMAGALDAGVLTPQTPFFDSGTREEVCDTTIRNADSKKYEQTDMTGVLENSINTGMVKVVELLGKHEFIKYIENFGFGVKTGIALDTERAGNISSLYVNKRNKVDCYAATASFGQGITATPLQMASSFSAIANGGKLMKPYIIDKIIEENGKEIETRPKEVAEVISKRASSLLAGMLVRVVDAGHATGADVPGYYVAGKTGTAQISGRGGYTEDTNHSFVGFAPVDDPKFVMIVKFEKPQRRFSSTTAAPTFGKIAKFILNYYAVPPSR